MNIPVFEHTIRSLRALISNENEPLQSVSYLIKYDPGLYFSLLQGINSSDRRKDVSTISQAISLIGSEGVERHILQQDYFLDGEYLLLWGYSVIAGCAAVLINQRADIAEEEEAYFAGILPSVGMLLMLEKGFHYKKTLEILLKIPTEDKIFIEERLYKTNHLEQLDKHLSVPKLYKDTVNIMNFIFSKEGQRTHHVEHPARFSVAYKSFQLCQLMDTCASAARSLLFPSIVEAQEKFRELAKRYFKVSENDIEEIMADVLEGFETACNEFGVQELSERILSSAETFISPGLTFLTKSEQLEKSLQSISEASHSGRNILIYGDAGVGKRLLAVALHRDHDNPRKTEAFLSYHCSALDSETLEIELFGTKGGFLGLEKHKGALEMANGGTILLKDIDTIPLTLQDMLAEVFNKDEFYKIGETHPAFFDIKIFITSRKNIIEEAKEGRFSERLLRALDPVSIYIPPLRDRREDIEFIADSIIEKYNLGLNDPALRLGLQEYYVNDSFPENLRGLKRLLFYLSAKHRFIS